MAALKPFPPTQIDWSRIKGIVFDLGNVLLDLDNAYYGKGWPHDISPNPTAFKQWESAQKLFYRYETGAIDSLDFRFKLTQELGLSPKQVTDYWNKILLPGIHEKRFETLKNLQKKYPLFVLSNTNAIHIAWVRAHVDAIGFPDFEKRFFDYVVYSYQAGSIKPEPGIYQTLENNIPLVPEDLLFIDDKVENLEAATARGWQSIWLSPGRPVEEVLQPLLS